jgi:hypothetical protein
VELAQALKQTIEQKDGQRITTRRYLIECAKEMGHGGKETVTNALDFLRGSEDIIVRKGVMIIAADGKERKGDLWSPRKR